MGNVFIIAEAGVNHNGNLEIAKKMVDIAKHAGADAIKFQTFKANQLVSEFAPKAQYQKKTTSPDESQFEMVKKLELDAEAHIDLLKYCKEKGITFLSSPFDLDSIDFLNKLGLQIFKVPSGEITNLPYLRRIGQLRKKVILSTGMCNLGEIEDALDILIKAGTPKKNITVLHCNTEYPTPYKDVNLLAMVTIKNTLGVEVGYSDHTLGIEVPIAAVVLGAKIIEKHFTLDKNMQGPDHKASLEPGELKKMIEAIRNVETALGDGIKHPSLSEMKNINIVRKSIVAAKDIHKEEVFTERNITTKRAGGGLSPMMWDNIIGRQASKDFREGELITL